MNKKTKTSCLFVTLLLSLLLNGCGNQVGETKMEVAGWDQDGPFVGRVTQKGFQTAIGSEKVVTHLNDNFNQHLDKKDDLEIIDKSMKRDVIRNTNELIWVYDSIFHSSGGFHSSGAEPNENQ